MGRADELCHRDQSVGLVGERFAHAVGPLDTGFDDEHRQLGFGEPLQKVAVAQTAGLGHLVMHAPQRRRVESGETRRGDDRLQIVR